MKTSRPAKISVPHSVIRYLVLAGIAALFLQLPDVSAQERVRANETRNEDRDNRDEPRAGSRKEKAADRKGSGRERETGRLKQSDDMSGRAWPTGMWSQNEWAGRNRSGNGRAGYMAGPTLFGEGKFESAPVDDGFVFVNGVYLAGPYVFRSDGEQTFVNDVLIANELVEFPQKFSGGGFGDGRGMRRPGGLRQTLAQFANRWFNDSIHILVAFDGYPPELLPCTPGGNDLICALVSEKDRATLIPDILNNLEPTTDTSVWKEWITDYQPSPAFLEKGQPFAERILETYAENMAKHSAMKRLDLFNYPLTIVGMLISVIAIGHLMSNPPNGGKQPGEIEDSPEMLQVVTRSLGLVVALSALDLVWTLLASQAGSMREINPVGGRLIHDPAMLILFKVTMTALAAGLIFKLRHYRRAQLASWWACLILTLLTVRWLTFSSMLA